MIIQQVFDPVTGQTVDEILGRTLVYVCVFILHTYIIITRTHLDYSDAVRIHINSINVYTHNKACSFRKQTLLEIFRFPAVKR